MLLCRAGAKCSCTDDSMTALVNSGTIVICVSENNRSYLKSSTVICGWENKAVNILGMGT